MCGGSDPYFRGGQWDGNPENNKRADQRGAEAAIRWGVVRTALIAASLRGVGLGVGGHILGDMIFPNEAHAPTGNLDNLKWRNPDNPDEWCSDKEGCGPWVTPIHPRDSDPRCRRRQ